MCYFTGCRIFSHKNVNFHTKMVYFTQKCPYSNEDFGCFFAKIRLWTTLELIFCYMWKYPFSCENSILKLTIFVWKLAQKIWNFRVKMAIFELGCLFSCKNVHIRVKKSSLLTHHYNNGGCQNITKPLHHTTEIFHKYEVKSSSEKNYSERYLLMLECVWTVSLW